MPLSTPSFLLLLLLLLLMTSVISLTSGKVLTAQQEDDLVSFTESLRQCRGIVGLTLAVAKGNDTWTRGFGLADEEKGHGVSSSTLFGIGSLTKAFSTALLSLFLNHTSRYSWETPVVDILGEGFEMVNEQLTRQVTLKDLLTHRTGLDTTNLPFYAGSTMTRAEFAKRVRYLPTKKLFRDEFDYNNWMYGLAGHVTEVMSGVPWEEALQARLLQPLNMTDTGVLGKTVTVVDERVAKPYVLLGGETVPSDPAIYSINPQEAAGAIASSADDMAKWLLLHINKGWSETGGHVVNDTRMREMKSAHVSLSQGFRAHANILKPMYPVTYLSEGYGYGWMTATYRGYPVMWHSGGIYAYTSYLALVPHLDVGFFISNNGPGGGSNTSEINQQVFYYLADLLLEEEPWLNVSSACQAWPSKASSSSSSSSSSSNHTVYDDPEFHTPERYAGRYEHQLYGEVKVMQNGSRGLVAQYGHLEGRLLRGQQDAVAMWEVLGKMAFLFRPGEKTSYLQLNFSRPGGRQGQFRGLVLSTPGGEDRLHFGRPLPPGDSSPGEGRDGVKGTGVLLLLLCLSLGMSVVR